MKKILVLFFLLTPFFSKAQSSIDYQKVSQTLLKNIIDKKSYQKQIEILAKSTLKELTIQLKTDTDKLAFWINIYNAFIQVSLTENSEEYENRGAFFKKPRVKIAEETLSFDNIEHSILRKSRIKISLGYLRKWFRPIWERKLRIDHDIDWRIHFALNCGAKSCPPVAVYTPENLERQLDFMTTRYLNQETTYDSKTKTATTTPLISWFRGDFEGISSAKKILVNYKITPEKPKKLEFKSYDWTMFLDNFREIPL